MSTVPKKPTKLRPDVAETAFRVMQEATGEAPRTLPPKERTEKNPEAVSRGKRGGQVGGKSRSAKLSEAERRAIAKRAADVRWRRKDR